MLTFGIFLAEIILLFIFSQLLTKSLSRFFLSITHSQHTTIQLLAFLFLPGVIIHELAHFIIANILFVQTGEIEFLPQIQGDSVKLGSVAIAKTDPLRRFLIGVAPLLFGTALLTVSFYYFSAFFPGFNWQSFLLGYISFEIGNTMFSSKKDMEGSLVLGIGLLFFLVAFWILGLRFSLESVVSFLEQPAIVAILQKGVIILAFPLIVNTIFLVLFKIFDKPRRLF